MNKLFFSLLFIIHSMTATSTDILHAKIYTLSNGLKVYMTVNKVEPKIQTYIAVKAGSKFDPSETTGLAHYLEHLMFKGTPNLGTTNWEKESVLLDKIAELYEAHKAEKDPIKKKAIYSEIDQVSYEASKYAVPNEYDKIVTSLGAQGTNAYTSNDQTVYQNIIPSNELDKWLQLESERFQHLTMRLFHTELEAVYEEYNISQDNDGRWAYANLLKVLYPNHPYGTQTTIGEGEHLKNPSHKNIRNYFERYYVPNNVAICLSGDIDPEKALPLIEKYFGNWKRKEITNPFVMPTLPKIQKPLSIENFGPQEEFVYVGFRTPAFNDKESLKATVLDQIMANGTAGLIDLNIVQKQKALDAYSFNINLHDASVFALYGKPKNGQTLEDVRDLLLEQVEKVKRGEFDEWLMKAGVNDLELKLVKGYESNTARAGAFVSAFTNDIDWTDYANRIDDMRKITKQDIVDFANTYFQNNYAVSYKRKGKEEKPKVEKPKITPVVLNRDVSSDFFKLLTAKETTNIDPVFVDYQSAIQGEKLANGSVFNWVKNTENNYAKYCLVYSFGNDNSKELGIASRYLEFLGTDKLSAEDFKKELYKYGLEISANASRDRLIVTLSGLEASIPQGMKLLYDKISSCKVDAEAWQNMIDIIKKERDNAKINKGAVFGGLAQYAKYGSSNPYNSGYTNEELSALKPEQIVDYIHQLTNTAHNVFFYGMNEKNILSQLPSIYTTKWTHATPQAIHSFKIQESPSNKILFYNYPTMVQAQIMLTHRGENFDKNLMPFVNLYNDFFGAGLSSIVFQELREQKALAYSANSRYGTPETKGEPFFFTAFIGTQADKMGTAAKEFKKLLNTNPTVEIQFNNAKESVIKQISASRIVRDNIYWNYLQLQKLGIDYDYRKDVLASIKSSTLSSFIKDFESKISNKTFTTVIMGDKSKLKMDEVSEFGTIQELNATEVFGY